MSPRSLQGRLPRAQPARSGPWKGHPVKHNKIVIVLGLMLAALTAAPAYAQRVYVASQGSDANNCSLQLPCRSLQHAVTVSESGGEIAILNTGGYNGGTAVTINKAISIVNQGGYEAGISFLSGVPGIVINAGPNDGISFISTTATSALTVSNSLVADNAGSGIVFEPTDAATAVFNRVEVNNNK